MVNLSNETKLIIVGWLLTFYISDPIEFNSEIANALLSIYIYGENDLLW